MVVVLQALSVRQLSYYAEHNRLTAVKTRKVMSCGITRITLHYTTPH